MPVPTEAPQRARLSGRPPGARVRGLPRATRLILALTAVLLALVVVVIAGAGGSGDQPPATGAAALVPADALAYVHLSLDPGRAPVKRALTLAERFPDFPLLQAALETRLGAIGGGGAAAGAVNFASDVRPWLGREAALAFLNTSTATAGSMIVLDVSSAAKARAFLARFGAGTPLQYNSTAITAYGSGTEVAFVGHYLVLGQDLGVRAAIDAAAGRRAPLARNSAYQRAVAGEPAGRVLDLYASLDGVRRLLAPQGGVVGALGALLFQPALDGVSIALTPRADGAAVRVHSALDSRLAKLDRAANGGTVSFSPVLPSAIPDNATVMLDLTKLDREAPRLLGASAAGGVGAGVLALLRRLGAALQAQGVNVRRDILPAFHGETAVAILPAAAGARSALLVIARADDEQRTRAAMAAIQAPLAQLFPPPASGPGRAPVFTDHQLAGITAHQLVLSTGLELDYAVFDHKLVVANSLDAIGAVRSHRRSLSDEPAYRATLADRPSRLTSLVFLNFSQLLSLAEQTGLTRSARYNTLRADLQKVRAVGLSSTSGEADSTAELFLQIP